MKALKIWWYRRQAIAAEAEYQAVCTSRGRGEASFEDWWQAGSRAAAAYKRWEREIGPRP